MALTLQIRMSATILDELDVQSEAVVYALVDPTTSFDTIITQFNNWLTDLDACTDGQISNPQMCALPALPGGIKTDPVALSRVEQTGVIAFDADGDIHQWATAIPALSNSDTVTSGGKVITTLGSPVEVLAGLLAGGGTAQLAWTNAVGQALTAATSALISFRRHTHQMVEATYERV